MISAYGVTARPMVRLQPDTRAIASAAQSFRLRARGTALRPVQSASIDCRVAHHFPAAAQRQDRASPPSSRWTFTDRLSAGREKDELGARGRRDAEQAQREEEVSCVHESPIVSGILGAYGWARTCMRCTAGNDPRRYTERQ